MTDLAPPQNNIDMAAIAGCLDDTVTSMPADGVAVESMELSEEDGHETEMPPSAEEGTPLSQHLQNQSLVVSGTVIRKEDGTVPDLADDEQVISIPLSITVHEQREDGKAVPTKLLIYPGNIVPPVEQNKVDDSSTQQTSNLQIQTTASQSTVLFQLSTNTPQNINTSDKSRDNNVDKSLAKKGAVVAVSTDPIHCCNLCDYITEHKHNLKTHMLVHTKPTVREFYKCEECDYITPLKYNLKTHMKKHADLNDLSENDIFRCKECSYVSAYKHDLQTHVKKHAPEKQYKCEQCAFTSIYKHSLIHHVSSKHNHERPHKCPECKYSSARKQDLLTHMGKHAAEKPFQCKLCDYGTPYKQSFKAHMNRHLGNKTHKCYYDGCDFATTTTQNLKSHLARHSNVKQFQCSFCDYSATHKTQLTNHLTKHDDKEAKSPRKFSCVICDYETTHKYCLKRHIQRHSETREMPEKVFQCDQCGYQTGYKSSLKRHLAKHSDVKPFKCGHCEYSAINMTQMHVHIAKHTGIKPFKCAQCDYATANKQHLVGHMAKHSDVRYKCPFCEFSTAWKQRLTIHLKQHQLGTLHMSPQELGKVNQQEQPEGVSIVQDSDQQLYHTETIEALSQLSNTIAAFHDYMQEAPPPDSDHLQPEGVGHQFNVSSTAEVIVASASSNMEDNQVLLVPSQTELSQQDATVVIIEDDQTHQQVQLMQGEINKPTPSSELPTSQGETSLSLSTEIHMVAPVTTQQSEVFSPSVGELNQVTSVEIADGEPTVVYVAETVIGKTCVVGSTLLPEAETV